VDDGALFPNSSQKSSKSGPFVPVLGLRGRFPLRRNQVRFAEFRASRALKPLAAAPPAQRLAGNLTPDPLVRNGPKRHPFCSRFPTVFFQRAYALSSNATSGFARLGVDGRDKRGQDAVAEPVVRGSTANAIRARICLTKNRIKCYTFLVAESSPFWRA
jgi:hypothetical protein